MSFFSLMSLWNQSLDSRISKYFGDVGKEKLPFLQEETSGRSLGCAALCEGRKTVQRLRFSNEI